MLYHTLATEFLEVVLLDELEVELADGEGLCGQADGQGKSEQGHASITDVTMEVRGVPRLVDGAPLQGQWPVLACMIASTNETARMDGVSALRHSLVVRDEPICVKVIAVPLAQCLLPPNEEYLSQEAAWCLSEIAAGCREECAALVDAGVIPLLASALSSCEGSVADQVVCCLANVAGDRPEFRDLLLASGVLAPVLALPMREAALRPSTMAWFLRNVCTVGPLADPAAVIGAVPVLVELLAACADDEQQRGECAGALAVLIDTHGGCRERALRSGLGAALNKATLPGPEGAASEGQPPGRRLFPEPAEEFLRLLKAATAGPGADRRDLAGSATEFCECAFALLGSAEAPMALRAEAAGALLGLAGGGAVTGGTAAPNLVSGASGAALGQLLAAAASQAGSSHEVALDRAFSLFAALAHEGCPRQQLAALGAANPLKLVPVLQKMRNLKQVRSCLAAIVEIVREGQKLRMEGKGKGQPHGQGNPFVSNLGVHEKDVKSLSRFLFDLENRRGEGSLSDLEGAQSACEDLLAAFEEASRPLPPGLVASSPTKPPATGGVCVRTGPGLRGCTVKEVSDTRRDLDDGGSVRPSTPSFGGSSGVPALPGCAVRQVDGFFMRADAARGLEPLAAADG